MAANGGNKQQEQINQNLQQYRECRPEQQISKIDAIVLRDNSAEDCNQNPGSSKLDSNTAGKTVHFPSNHSIKYMKEVALMREEFLI
jgi:hypothetical protein